MSVQSALDGELFTRPAPIPLPEQQLPPLPATMQERPFGADGSGQPIRQASGSSVLAAISQMQFWVGRNAERDMPPRATYAGRQAQVATAQAAALSELVKRLNAAISDRAYHVSSGYLLNAEHQYSHEFNLYVNEYARDICGDPDFHFHRGLRSIPTSLIYVGRPLSLRQLYSAVPRLIGKISDADMRVASTTDNAATLQWHPDRQLALLPVSLHPHYLRMACQAFQAAYAVIPVLHSGLPPADIRETRCALGGDAYCEWEFTWQTAPRRGLGRLWPLGRGDKVIEFGSERRGMLRLWPLLGRPSTGAADVGSPVPPGVDDRLSGGRQVDLTTHPAPPHMATDEIPALPTMMAGTPFGTDADGEPIRHVSGALMQPVIFLLQDWAERHATRDLLRETDAQARRLQIAQARKAALDELVARLNAAIPEPRHHVSREYLLDAGNYYSYEFYFYANAIAREISGDPHWSFHRGMRSIPPSMLALGHALSLRQVYSLLPRLAQMVTSDDIRVISTTANSAIVQLHRGKHNRSFANTYSLAACHPWQGTLAAIPWVHSHMPIARIKENRCIFQGDEHCEWEFTWQNPKPGIGLEVWVGGIVTALLVAFVLLAPGTPWWAAVSALVPAGGGWLLSRIRQWEYEREQQRRQLLEQRENAEKQYDTIQRANADLQVSNITLQHRISELTAVHEIGMILSATLELDDLLEDSLHAVTTHLGFDRALMMLLDEERSVLTGGRSIGGTAMMTAMMEEYEIALDGDESILARTARSRVPVLVDVATEPLGERVRQVVEALETGTFLAVPLVRQGKAMGVLAVDNAGTGRPIPSGSGELLLTVGAQIAAAIDSTRLRQTLEERVARRTAELDESQRRLADIVDFLPDATLVIDHEGKVIAWNRAIEAMTGVKAEEMLGKGNYEYAIPFYGQRRPILIDLVNLTQTELEQRYANLKRDGNLLTAEAFTPGLQSDGGYLFAAASALYDSQGNAVGAVESIRDITERRGAEEALRESEARFRLLADIGQALSSTLDMQSLFGIIYGQVSRVMYAENMIIALYDQTADEEDFVYSHNPDEVAVGTRRPVQGGLTSHIIRERRPLLLRGDIHAEGSKLGIEIMGPQAAAWLGVPMLIGQRALGMIAVQHYADPHAYDDSHRELLEAVASQAAIALENARLYQEVQREERYLELLIQASPTAIAVIDMDARVQSWNPAAERLFGYSRQEALGLYIGAIVARTETMQAQAAAHTHQAARGESIHEVTQRIRRDGSLLDVELLAVPLIVEGTQTGTLVIYHDITELQRARQDAEAANQAKSTFLAAMSHEIRTPMNAVIGMTGLLLDTPLTPNQKEFAEAIRTSGDSLLTIINDILDFSKVEAGRMELESRPFDLRECVEGAIELFAAKAAEKDINLACLLGEELPPAIVGDVTRLRQIVVNLLSNAVKFTEQGEVVLSVKAESDRGPLDAAARPASSPLTLRFAVQDTGIGIPPNRMDRLFRSFSQVDASTTRRFGGTGLGLAISRRLCELMGGAMWAESEGVPGKGSTFHFTIQAETAPAVYGRTHLLGIQPHMAGKRALIVDDNPTNRRILTLQVQSWGMLPRDTAFPCEALEWIRRGDPFDVAFLDLQMPGMDGLTLAREISQVRDAATLPLILASSWGQREIRDSEGLYAACLIKPLRASQIYDVLVSIFGRDEGTASLPQADSKPQFDVEMGRRHPLRILLAEDNATNQKLAMRLLERMGYRVDIAANGTEALRSLRQQPYDVVLMDVQMPEMDGLEATRAIWREWPGEQRPRIVAMTANAMQEDREECLAAGMDDFVSKPICVDELVRALAACQPLTETARPIICAPMTNRSAATPAPSTAVPDVAALNPAALDRLREMGGGDEMFVAELIGIFLADAPRMLAEMRRALELGDATTLRRVAHSLKSNSRDFGAEALAQVCLTMETLGKEGKLDGAMDKLTEAETEYGRVANALHRLRRA